MKLYELLKLNPTEQAYYLAVFNAVKPKPFFYKRHFFRKKKHGVNQSITELTFGEVNQIKALITSDQPTDLIKAVELGFNIKNALKLKAVIFYQSLNFLIKEVENLIQIERKRYQLEPTDYDAKMEQAGVNELKRFADLPIIDNLAKENILNYEQIENLPYATIHYILWFRAVKENINIRFNKLNNLK